MPKAGVFAHGQAEVVARRIAAELTGEAPSASFEGKGSCFVELGDGIAACATGDFYAEAGPEVALRRPGRRWAPGEGRPREVLAAAVVLSELDEPAVAGASARSISGKPGSSRRGGRG